MKILRRRPWLVGCLIMLVVAASVLASHRFPGLVFWAGILAVLGAVLTAAAGEAGLRRQQPGPDDEFQ